MNAKLRKPKVAFSIFHFMLHKYYIFFSYASLQRQGIHYEQKMEKASFGFCQYKL